MNPPKKPTRRTNTIVKPRRHTKPGKRTKRRELSLLRQKQSRLDAPIPCSPPRLHPLLSQPTPSTSYADDDNDLFDIDTEEEDEDDRQKSPQLENIKDVRQASRLRGQESRRWFAHQLILPEWMIDIPDCLSQGWFVLARPAGERCFVVSINGTTVSRLRNGSVLHHFPSALPCGARTRENSGSAQSYCILDCIFHEMDQTYYVIDMVCWRGYSLYDCNDEFRFFWLSSKLAEGGACESPSQYHRYQFSPVPVYNCDQNGLLSAYTGQVPYVKDGLLFYNKHAHYQSGNTPLTLVWKDEKCSQYVIDTDINGEVPSKQQIVENLARKYGVSKSDLLDREADDVAVRIALGETSIIVEIKKALTKARINVVSLEEFAARKSEGAKRSNHVLLVKNLPFSSSKGELSEMFGRFGSLDNVIFPPTRTLALVIFVEPAEARAAFNCLCYKRYRDSILYLEWAPSNILCQDLVPSDDSKNEVAVKNREAKEVLLEQQLEEMNQVEIDSDEAENLHFGTTNEKLGKYFRENVNEGKILSARVVKHLEGGKYVSSGCGFVEFDSLKTANNVLRELQGIILDGHMLKLQLSHPKKDMRALEKVEKGQSSMILIVRNLPFKATKKELRQLFSPFGHVKSLRLPMNFGGGKHRGFAFVEYSTKQEVPGCIESAIKDPCL